MAQPRKDKDPLGTRMKAQYEVRSQTHLPRRTTTVIRLDGKAFHSYTRGLERPFDQGLMDDMDETARRLCYQIQGAKIAYVQSDEISIILTDFDDITTEAWFDGNVQKMTSISAAMAAAEFNRLRLIRTVDGFEDIRKRHDEFPGRKDWASIVYDPTPIFEGKLAYFDSRVFTIPDPTEVENYLIWRQQDATRNSIQMAAQSMFSHKVLHGVNTSALQEKMWSEKGVNWNDYPDGFKRGRCVVRIEYVDEVSGGMRSKWVVEAPPVFTQDREYMRRSIPRL